MSRVIDFVTLFEGRGDALGLGRGGVEHQTVTVGDYEDHLNGEGEGIGIFPLRDDGTVMFAAIDLDEPNFELARSFQRLIPGTSWIERSRSGNAHVWVFFREPCPAWAARAVLRSATESLGRNDVEIFPKQDRVRPGGVGNYINLPLHGAKRPIVGSDDTPYGRVQFIEQALAQRSDPEAFIKRARALGGKPPEEREETSEWGTSPILHVCAEKIIAECEENPISAGHRHQVLFHLAVQCLNYEGFDKAEAWSYVQLVNDNAAPPLGSNELERLFANAYDGRYTFTGCDDPVMAPYIDPECPIAGGRAGR